LAVYWVLEVERKVTLEVGGFTGAYELVRQLYPGTGYLVYSANGVHHFTTCDGLIDYLQDDRHALRYFTYDEDDNADVLDITICASFTPSEKARIKKLCRHLYN
jgi:hypothetical protein